MNARHEQRMARVFVELSDTLADDFDTVEFLSMLVERCVELLDVAAAGVVLSDRRGTLRMAAASSERARLVALFAIQAAEGPCLDCVRTGHPVDSTDLVADTLRWPRFAPAARAAGFVATRAVPMRLRRTVVGALNLFDAAPNGMDASGMQLGQALADVATIGMLQHRAIGNNTVLIEQLQTALNSRVVIEQAKGVLSAHGGIDMDRAFGALRGYARAHNLRLSALAFAVARGTADLQAIMSGGAPDRRRQA